MDADLDAGLFGDRDDLPDEVFVVAPYLLLAVLAAVRERPVELAVRRAANGLPL